ncbi:MAG: hypothetical protein LDLANPLL_01801 [Turneriella sp.]|nr:hypothetical protein [Turneriella sp.]
MEVNEDWPAFIKMLSLYGPRLLAAIVAGSIIGLEGELSRRAAGLRTTLLIMIGSCLFAILSVAIATRFGGDPGRIAAQIVTGIGFLGAGVIMHEGDHIFGITTASTVFATAAIGTTTGFGYIYSGVALAIIVALVLIVFRPVRKIVQKFSFFNRFGDHAYRAKTGERVLIGQSGATPTDEKN